ncbi:hypothetical protein SAMN04488038_1135 [Solimonas aquatica]|uniref:Uncharacterized protein n=1 Tax=Solimonas aquatica TaxID=489703 RepID=A0A1H9KAB2_9GAMM|nr:hypothetical protein SAMN04488038_1135 [Solimonas aquatica]
MPCSSCPSPCSPESLMHACPPKLSRCAASALPGPTVGRVRRARAGSRRCEFAVFASRDAQSIAFFHRPSAADLLLFACAKRSKQEKAHPGSGARCAGAFAVQRARGRCRHAILAWLQLSRTSMSGSPLRSPHSSAPETGTPKSKATATAASSDKRRCAAAFDLPPLCLAPSSAASAVGESNRKFDSVAAAPWMARLQRPRAREQRRLPAPRQRRRMRGVGCAFFWLLFFAQAKKSSSGADRRTKPRRNRAPYTATNSKAQRPMALARLSRPTVLAALQTRRIVPTLPGLAS